MEKDKKIVVLCYQKCTTCKKALKWLDEQKIRYETRAIKEENPTKDDRGGAAWTFGYGRDAGEAAPGGGGGCGADRI